MADQADKADKPLQQHEQVGQEYLDGARGPTLVHAFPFPAKVVFAALEDGPAWGEWLPGLQVEWTSPKPFKEGTTRTVKAGAHTIEEVFFAWEDGRRFAFRFDRTTMPIGAGVEEYALVDTDDGCELHWTLRLSPKNPLLFPLSFLVSRGMIGGFRKGLPLLQELIAKDPARFGGGAGEPPKAPEPKPEAKAPEPKPEPKAPEPKPEAKAPEPKPEPKPEAKAPEPKPEPKAAPAKEAPKAEAPAAKEPAAKAAPKKAPAKSSAAKAPAKKAPAKSPSGGKKSGS